VGATVRDCSVGIVDAYDRTGDVFRQLDKVIEHTVSKDRPALIVALAARLAALGAALAEPAGPTLHPAPAETSGRLLSAAEAAQIAGVSPRWLLRRTRGLRFRHDLSRKQARFEEQGLRRWLLR
jgi:hypothetical protein